VRISIRNYLNEELELLLEAEPELLVPAPVEPLPALVDPLTFVLLLIVVTGALSGLTTLTPLRFIVPVPCSDPVVLAFVV
jgi:hypothetical protein